MKGVKEVLLHGLVHRHELEDVLVGVGLDDWLSGDRHSLVHEVQTLGKLGKLVSHREGLCVELLLVLSDEHV